MDETNIQIILDYIADEWQRLRKDQWANHEGEQWPYGAWIRLHEPLPVGADQIETPLSAAWFLDANGLRRMDTASFVRFWTVQIQQTWVTGFATSPDHADFTRTRHRIGMAAFAPYGGTDEFYLETIWGGLSASGMRATVRGGQLEILGFLWIA